MGAATKYEIGYYGERNLEVVTNQTDIYKLIYDTVNSSNPD